MDNENNKVKSHTGDQNGGGGGVGQVQGDESPNTTIAPLVIVIGLLLLLIPAVLIIERNRPPQYWPRDFYAVDQVILTGTEDEIATTIADLKLDRFLGDPDILSFDSDLLQERSCTDLYERYGGENPQVIALYTITRRLTNVIDMIEQIQGSPQEQQAQATGAEAVRRSTIRAEPNWVSGQPWEIEGSPWEIEGSPWEIEGSPGDAKPQSAEEAVNDYIAQGAMITIDNKPPADESGAESPDEPNVRVGVFDTSPFADPIGSGIDKPVSWVSRPASGLTLTLDHPIEQGQKSGVNFNDHGLFVAGLVHAVAPNSSIELVRVLDSNNKGDLYRLIEELYRFIASVKGDTEAVINLSLGMRLIPDEAEGFEALSRELGSLADVLAFAECSDIVVVAAAGNGSANKDEALDAYYPAAWTEVIGVAASNDDNERSCYSNKGDVAAPGGDGHAKKNDCRPLHYTCEDAQCKHAVLGPVLQREKRYPSGFAYWVGSSFSTPLVSGLAARIRLKDPGLSSEAVQAIIKCSAEGTSSDGDLGAGVIDVQKAIDVCLPQYSEMSAE